MSDSPIRVLIVDDEESLRVPLADWLAAEHGYLVETAASGLETLEMLAADGCFDVILLDYLLPPPYNGITLMEEIKRRCLNTSMDFIIFTGWGLEPQVGVEALKAGAYRYLAKPFDWEELAILIQSIVETRRTREKLEATSREKAWLESLLQVSQSVNSTLELDQVLELILDEMKRVVVYDSASIQHITGAGLQVVACRGFSDPGELLGHVFPRSDELPNYRVWQSRQPRIEYDLHAAYHARHVRGWLGVPLIYHDEAIGVITLDSQTPGFYDENDASIATIFANQAAIAIENARLYDRELKQAQTLKTLLEVEQEVTRNITTQSKVLLDKIAHRACQMTGADCAVIYPYLAESRRYDLANVGAFGLRRQLKYREKLRPAEGPGVSSRVLREGRMIIYDAAQDDPNLLQHNFVKREHTRSFVGIRLDATEPVGILFVNFRQPHLWTDDELDLIDLFANQAAIAIWNARLYGRTSEKLEQKVAELQTVGEINQLITSTLSLGEVLPLILDKAMELVNVQHGVLQLIDDETGELVIQSRKGLTLVPLERPRLKPGEGITGKAVQEKRSIIVHDVTQPPWRDIYVEFWPGTRSELAVPLLINERCIGVLNFEHPEPGYFSEDEREIVEGMATQAAIAIQNAQRYDELEQAKDALAATEAVAWMGLFGSSWAHGVTQKTSAVRNYLTVLADYLPQDGKVQELLIGIEDAVKAMQVIPIVQKLPSESRVAATLDLDATLRDQVRRWCRSHSEIELVFDMKCEGIRTHIDKEWLDVAMEKLINNALRAMPGSGQLKIASAYRGGKVEVKVVDTGYGISEEIRPYFLKKQIPQEFTSAGGTGIGALIARYIFRAFGGDLDLLWSEGGRGTGLRITLPATPIEML
jgi:GAF domain-containing protein/AmiR/NasT family two-component response regulator